MHDGFVKVFQKIEQYDGRTALETWIRSIMVYGCLDTIRRSKKIDYVDDNVVLEERSAFVGTSDQLEHDDLLNIIDQLPNGAKVIFNLYAVEGFMHKEIAEMMNISESTSKSQYQRAKKTLRKLIGNQYNL